MQHIFWTVVVDYIDVLLLYEVVPLFVSVSLADWRCSVQDDSIDRAVVVTYFAVNNK